MMDRQPSDWQAYLLDAAQRSVLFLDVMRQRGNQYIEHMAQTVPHVLSYDFEPHNNHIWLPLDAPWTGADFAAKAADRGILVSPAEHFAIEPARAPAAIRLCLPNIDEAQLADALETLVALARGRPGPVEFRIIGIDQERPTLQRSHLGLGSNNRDVIGTHLPDDRRCELLVTPAKHVALPADRRHHDVSAGRRSIERGQDPGLVHVARNQLAIADNIHAQ